MARTDPIQQRCQGKCPASNDGKVCLARTLGEKAAAAVDSRKQNSGDQLVFNRAAMCRTGSSAEHNIKLIDGRQISMYALNRRVCRIKETKTTCKGIML